MKTKALIIYCFVIIGVLISQRPIAIAAETEDLYWQYHSPCTCDNGTAGHWYKCEKDGNTLEDCSIENRILDCQNNQTGQFCEDAPI